MNPQLNVLRILWSALLVSAGAFAAVVLVVPTPRDAVPQPIMLPVFGFVALMSGVLSFVLPVMSFKQGAKRASIPTAPSAGGGGMPQGMFQGAGAARKLALNPQEATKTAYQLFQPPFILSLALSESIATLGVAMHMLGFPLFEVLPFVGVAALLILVRFPTEKRIVGMFESATGIDVTTRGGGFG